MEYKLLSDDDKHEHIGAFAKAQEADHYLHCVNRDRYKKILKSSAIGDRFRQRINKLLAETEERIEECEAIISATYQDFPDAEPLKAGLARLEARKR